MGLGARARHQPGLPFARLPFRAFRSSLRSRDSPFGSDGRTVRSVSPQATDSLACASEPCRPATRRRGGSPKPGFCRPDASGALRRSTGRVSRRSPRWACRPKHFSYRLAFPLLPGNFRPSASLKPSPQLGLRLAFALRRRSREDFRPREPLDDWNLLEPGFSLACASSSPSPKRPLPPSPASES